MAPLRFNGRAVTQTSSSSSRRAGGFLRVVGASGVGTAPIPLKTISLTLMGWHDPKSDKFMRNCIACHGTRTQERALDGTTPTAHSIAAAALFDRPRSHACWEGEEIRQA